MRQAWIVARREFFERVRTKWFAIVTLLGPLGLIAILVIPAWLSMKSAEEGFRIEIVDKTGRDLGEAMAAEVEAGKIRFHLEAVDPDTPEDVLLERIRSESIDGYLELPETLFANGKASYYGDNASNVGLERLLDELVRFSVVRAKASEMGLSVEQVRDLLTRVDVETVQTTGTGEAKSGKASFVAGYVVMFVLYLSIILYAVNVLRSVVMEKSNRVVELVVSSLKPRALMIGKVLGVAGVGLLQLSFWALVALVLIHFREAILGVFGVPEVGAFDVPVLGVGDLVLVLAYFLLGFFFYASLYAAIGAMVNSEQEAQQAQTPVLLLLIIPAACVQIVAGDPRGLVAEVLTQIPFSSPILMPMRYLLDAASPLEVIVSVAILALSTIGAVAVAARIYRVGILMYGKRPSLGELWRWIRS